MSNVFDELEKQHAQTQPSGQEKGPNVFDTLETEHADNLTWGDALVTGFKNVPKSAKKYVTDIVDAVKNYKETGPALAKTFAGAVESVIPGEQGDEPYFEALIQSYKEKYGDIKSFKKAIASDPVSVLNDASLVLMGAGTGLKVAGMGGKLSKVGNVVSKAGEITEPVRAATYLPGKLVNPLANKMYRMANKFAGVKPKHGLSAVQREKSLAEFGMEHNIMPNSSGLEKIQAAKKGLENRLDKAIKVAEKTKGNPTIKVDDLFAGFDDLREEWAWSGGEGIKYVNQIDRVESQGKKVIKDLLGKQELTLSEAQKLKKQIYHVNKAAYERGTTKVGTEAAQKVHAKNAKDFIESFVPEAKGINYEWSEWKDLEKAIDRAAVRISHREPLANIGVMGKGGVGAVLGGPAGAAAGISLGILDFPTVQAKVAILVRRLRKAGVKISPAMVTARILAAKSKYMVNQNSSEEELPQQ
jgi:hypothetical protein